MSIENPSATEYIQHHMQHLQSLHQQVIVDFSVFNYDTLFFSILSLLVVFFVLRLGAKKATSGVPGKMQCAVEMLVEMVNNQAKSIVHGDRTYIAPLALTVFCWVTIMNCIDLIPVDFFPWLAGLIGINHLRPLCFAFCFITASRLRGSRASLLSSSQLLLANSRFCGQ